MKIKILSVRQPWAWLICAGVKGVENRSWHTNYRGTLYIHAGKSFDWDGLDRLSFDMPNIAEQIIDHFNILAPLNFGRNIPKFEFGAIVGNAMLTSIKTNAASEWAEHGCYHWMVSDAFEIEPIPMRGQLQIFTADIDESLLKIKG